MCVCVCVYAQSIELKIHVDDNKIYKIPDKVHTCEHTRKKESNFFSLSSLIKQREKKNRKNLFDDCGDYT